ncbi:MAG: molybdopterin converting factor subunit 1 [Dehalococcoidia bacterium]
MAEIRDIIGRRPLKVRARFFAVYREKAGRREQEVELEEGADAAALLRYLGDEFGGPFTSSDSLVVAVNGEYVPLSHVLKEGDEVALIPPVSGG